MRFALRATGLLLLVLSVLVGRAEEKVQTRVSFTSQPSGAAVLIDGKERGTTPMTLFDLAPGAHHVKYRLPGYVEQDQFFSTYDGPFVEKSVTLAEEKGILLLLSDPPGCSVTIDGIAAGETPRLYTHLAAKDAYAVKLVKPGYQDLALTVKFNGRTPLVREEKLVLDSGVVDITSEPSGAEVTVNGIVRGTTPLLVKGVPKGRTVVKFHLAGFQDEVRELAMRAGDQQTLPIVLKALPGTLHLVSVPEGARFYVNDEARGVGPLAIPGLKPGDYTVRAEKTGFGTVTRTVTISNGESAREEFQLSSVMGRLEVRTEPVGAAVVLDGRLVGYTKGAPGAETSDIFPLENLLEGEHVIVIRKEGYAEQTRHPTVENSKTKPVNVRLKRVFTPNIEIVTDRGSYRGVLVSNSPDSVVIEVSLGITRSFPRSEIRKLNFLGSLLQGAK